MNYLFLHYLDESRALNRACKADETTGSHLAGSGLSTRKKRNPTSFAPFAFPPSGP